MPLIDGKFEALHLPEKHTRVLFDSSCKWRYRALYGGRSAAKDWSIAAACVEMGIRTEKRFLFTREIQHTIKQSAHQLIKDTIHRLGYQDYFDIPDNKIKCKLNGTFFIFMGLRDLNAKNVKSIEGIDICVVCESEDLTKECFVVLDPSIRKPGSEIWIQFNSQYEDDFVYDFCVTNRPDNMICDKVTYLDHPYNPPEITEQAERMRQQDPKEYSHTWKGDCIRVGGRFYPEFSKEVNVKSHECNRALFDFKYLVDNAQLFMAIDPHTVYYPFCIWVARVKLGKEMYYVVYNEFPTVGFFNGDLYHKIRKTVPCTLTMNELAGMFRILDCTVGNDQFDVTIKERYVDTRFAKASGAKSWSTNTEGLVSEFSKPQNGGVILKQPQERIIDIQKDTIREAIKINDQIPICSINQSRLVVMPHCHNVIDSMINHRYDMDNVTEDEKRKDASDALRITFAGMSRVDWQDHVEMNKKKEFILNSTKCDVTYSLA
jgi:phage terminase large subunit